MSIINSDTERRKFRRASLDTPLRYKFKQANEFGSTITRDISEGGLKLNLEKFVPINTDFVLELGLDKLSNIINAVGKVVWVTKIPHSERYQLGLEFQEINEQHKRDISSYIKSHRF
ncbi:MAG: PilZ domain-containing protein [Candidatus Omnitrophota bacterium]|nr:PilZ domain-containing protein [Candidatus Omnitrophota bacterium]